MTNTNPAGLITDFSLPVDKAKNLIDSADGMRPYGADAAPSWAGYPEKSAGQWEVSFDNQCQLMNEKDEFVKDPKDGAIDYKEKNLAATQIVYDSRYAPNYAQDTERTKRGILGDTAHNATMFLHSIFNGPNAEKYFGWGPTVQDYTKYGAKAQEMFEKLKQNLKEGSIRFGLDTDNDGKFTGRDVDNLSGLDGNPNDISNKDLEIAMEQAKGS